MRAGKMDRLIELCRRQTERSDAGEVMEDLPENLQTIVTCWAEVIWNRGGERWSGSQIAAEAAVMFRIRWRPFLTPVHVVRYEGQLYNILSAPEGGRRERIEIFCDGREDNQARAV